MLLRRTFFAVVLAGSAVFAAPFAGAQCFGPDGLDFGGCCQPAQLILPNFPGASVPGLGICWDNCNVSATNDLKVTWTPPTPASITCGQYSTLVTATDASSGVPLLTGSMVMDYTRTWDEIDSAGNNYQVWRFVVKVDLSPASTAGTTVCPVPSCLFPAGVHQTSFYYGYLDYALKCAAGSISFENALVLYHGCDFMIHKPGISDKPGTFHPGRAYAIVAPHSAAQPFIPGSAPAPSGMLIGEAMRNVGSAAGIASCFTEEKLSGGTLANFAQGCFCPLSSLPPQYSVSLFEGKGSCPDAVGNVSEFTSLNIFFPTLPWVHMVSASIGRWSAPSAYPGTEHAWVNEGLFRSRDTCFNQSVFEVKYGSTTKGGFTPILPVPILLDSFIDMADNYTAPVGGPHPFPIMGSVRPTDHLIYANVP